jgi:uncharacterized protein (TIGR03435 family)
VFDIIRLLCYFYSIMLHKQHVAFLAGTAIVVLGAARAQSISYVASIKPNNDVDGRRFSEYLPGGRFTATGQTVRDLIRLAYRIQPYQLAGAPAWIATKRFDIEAKCENSSAPPQQELLKALLRDRFQLQVHNETREQPIFALVIAKGDGKPGPQLIKSSFDCAAYFAGPHGPPEPGKTPNCATRIGMGVLSGKAIAIAQLATSLAPFVNRLTVDRTGLAGGYDIELTWTPEAAPSADGLPSIFTALQEQLGLKLVSEKGRVEVIVVDRVAEPSAN